MAPVILGGSTRYLKSPLFTLWIHLKVKLPNSLQTRHRFTSSLLHSQIGLPQCIDHSTLALPRGHETRQGKLHTALCTLS